METRPVAVPAGRSELAVKDAIQIAEVRLVGVLIFAIRQCSGAAMSIEVVVGEWMLEVQPEAVVAVLSPARY